MVVLNLCLTRQLQQDLAEKVSATAASRPWWDASWLIGWADNPLLSLFGMSEYVCSVFFVSLIIIAFLFIYFSTKNITTIISQQNNNGYCWSSCTHIHRKYQAHWLLWAHMYMYDSLHEQKGTGWWVWGRQVGTDCCVSCYTSSHPQYGLMAYYCFTRWFSPSCHGNVTTNTRTHAHTHTHTHTHACMHTYRWFAFKETTSLSANRVRVMITLVVRFLGYDKGAFKPTNQKVIHINSFLTLGRS